MAGGGGARPGAGRPKGSVNRLSREFAEKFDAACEERGFNLIEKLVEMCDDVDKEIALKARTLVMPYRYPKLRQVEVAVEPGELPSGFRLVIEKTEEKK